MNKLILILFWAAILSGRGFAQNKYSHIEYKFEKVDSINIFYREVGSSEKPTIVFLHGTPSSSYMYDKLIYNLKEDFHCIAPDYPSYGFSDAPSVDAFEYSFANLTDLMDKFLQQLGIEKYSIYMQDYGAPVGFRLSLKHPERTVAIITQNGNAYIDGFPLAQGEESELMKFWNNTDPKDREDFENYYNSIGLLSSSYWRISPKDSPDRRIMDAYRMRHSNVTEQRFRLWHNYGTNVEQYPQWHEYLRTHKPYVLVVWGKGDTFFTTLGGIAYLNDVPDAEVHLLNTGHWASFEEPEYIAELIKSFFIRNNINY